MNEKFDELAIGMAQSVTRRGALKKFALGLAGISLAAVGLANKAEAGRHNPPQGCKQTCDHCRYPYGCTSEGCLTYCNDCCGGPF